MDREARGLGLPHDLPRDGRRHRRPAPIPLPDPTGPTGSSDLERDGALGPDLELAVAGLFGLRLDLARGAGEDVLEDSLADLLDRVLGRSAT